MADNSSGLWSVDSGCGNVQYRSSTGAWTTALSVSIDPTKPASLAQRRDNLVIYASLSTSIIRIQRALVDCVKAGAGGCNVYNQTLVNTTAASNITLSFDESWLYYIDIASISRVNVNHANNAYPTTATTLVTTGLSQSVIRPTAIAMSPDGLGLIIADYLPANYTQIKYINLTSLAVTTIGPNYVQSNCGTNSPSYQNGLIGGPACFGLIHQIITGTGTLGNQLLFFEVNTGRIRALDWSSRLIRTLIGGGAVNDGFTRPLNTPIGWANGSGMESSLDTNLTGLVWDTTRNLGYVAQQVRNSQPIHTCHTRTTAHTASVRPTLCFSVLNCCLHPCCLCAELWCHPYDECRNRSH